MPDHEHLKDIITLQFEPQDLVLVPVGIVVVIVAGLYAGKVMDLIDSQGLTVLQALGITPIPVPAEAEAAEEAPELAEHIEEEHHGAFDQYLDEPYSF